MSKELLEKIWWNRNPQHEVNADTGKDMFFDTVKMVIDDYNTALKISSNPLLSDVSFCSCEVETNKYFYDSGVKRCYDCKKEAKWNS